MIYPDNRNDIRDYFFSSWDKYRQNVPLVALEQQIVDTIRQHPEYHYIFDNKEQYLTEDFSAESEKQNPFYHLGAHISLMEQISIDQPPGICSIYNNLITRDCDHHEIEHKMMGCLMTVIIKSQKEGTAPSNDSYLDLLKGI